MKYVGLVALLVLSLAATGSDRWPGLGFELIECTGRFYARDTPPGEMLHFVRPGTSWTLASMWDGDGQVRGVSPTPPVTLTFAPGDPDVPATTRVHAGDRLEDGMVTGSTGCNSYEALYDYRRHDDDQFRIRVRDLLMTDAACPSPALAEREREYIDILTNVWMATMDPDGREMIITTNSLDGPRGLSFEARGRPQSLRPDRNHEGGDD